MKNNMKALVLALFSSALGCFGDQGAEDYKLRDFANDYLPAYCAWGARCGLSENQKSCVDSFTLDIGSTEEAINSGRATFDREHANKCLAAMKALPCHGDSDLTDWCVKIIAPQVAKGGVCMIDDECKSYDCESDAPGCAPSTTCCPGKCAGDDLLSNLANDAACRHSLECASRICAAIDPSVNSDLKCVMAPSINEPCTLFCKTGLECRPQGATEELRCQPYPKTGEPCVLFCASLTDHCTSDGTCSPRAAAGKPCGQDDSCALWAMCSNGVCVNRATVGEACAVSGPDDSTGNCLYSLNCTNGKCTKEPSGPVCL